MNRIPKKEAAAKKKGGKPVKKTPQAKPAWAAIADQLMAAPQKKK